MTRISNCCDSCEATEVEHALMIQYLYAAFSLKSDAAPAAVRGVPSRKNHGNLLGIAAEEMGHFHLVNMLLGALGGAPNVQAQDFPFETGIYPFPLNLEPLSKRTLARYVFVEASDAAIDPKHPDNASPQRQTILEQIYSNLKAGGAANPFPNQLGSLYKTILLLMERARALPSGRVPPGFDFEQWAGMVREVQLEGEVGHYEFFLELFLGRHSGRPLSGDEKVNAWDLPGSDARYPVRPDR